MSVTGAPFAPYTHDLNVGGGGGQVDVAQAQGGEICHAHPGLDHGEQHSVVAIMVSSTAWSRRPGQRLLSGAVMRASI
ncbi:MAG: hypothetical protein WBG36_09695 [Ornithinimicrobium sp.]